MKAVILEITRELSKGTNDHGEWHFLLCQAKVDGQEKEISIFSTEDTPVREGWEYGGTLDSPRKPNQASCFQVDRKIEPIAGQAPIKQTPPATGTTTAATTIGNNYPHDLSARQTALKAASELTAAVLKLCCITESCKIGQFFWNKEICDLRIYVQSLAKELYEGLMEGK